MREVVIVVTKIVEVTDAEFMLVHELYNMAEPHKLNAVMFIKNQYSLGLKEAKDTCDTIGESII